MEQFLFNNIGNIIFVIAGIIILVILLKKGATEQLNDILFYLVLRAEREYGQGTGQLKYAAVVSWLYERNISFAFHLFTKKQINDMIEAAVVRLKDYLNSNPMVQAELKVKEVDLIAEVIESLKKKEEAKVE